MTDSHLSDLGFDTLNIHESLRAGIRDAGFEFCTPIQALTLPIALEERDLPLYVTAPRTVLAGIRMVAQLGPLVGCQEQSHARILVRSLQPENLRDCLS